MNKATGEAPPTLDAAPTNKGGELVVAIGNEADGCREGVVDGVGVGVEADTRWKLPQLSRVSSAA